MKRCSMSLIIREMQIKTTMRYYFAAVRMAIIHKSTPWVLARLWRKGNPMHCWWECRLAQPLGQQCRVSAQRWKWSSLMTQILLPGTYLKKPKTLIQKNTCTLMFTVALFTIVKIWKKPKCPSIDKCIKKWWYVCVCVYVCVCMYIKWSITQP